MLAKEESVGHGETSRVYIRMGGFSEVADKVVEWSCGGDVIDG